VEVAYAIGKEVKIYRKKRNAVLELKRNRARAKMYNAGTPLQDGEDPLLHTKVCALTETLVF
jgi:hypothetical protein